MNATERASYKARKEAFVSNLSGSSLTDIGLVTLVAPSALLLWAALQKRNGFFAPNDILALTVDYLLNVCAILFAFTAYSSAPIFLNVLLAVPAIILLLPLLPSSTKQPSSTKKAKAQSATKKDARAGADATNQLPSRPFITNYRGAMMVVTCIAILAVDFPIFPRRFAKVETWGNSLMDIGVGSFVFSAGLVSARQLLSGSTTTTAQTRPLYRRLLGSFRHSVPLFVLGFIRLYSVKGLDYAEHVTEYGVHWNFFFTLGLLPPFVELSDFLIRHVFRSYDVFAILIAVLYEIVLNNTSLLSYILISPRGPSLLSKNREGVFSFIGYLAIFLSGRGTGACILPLQGHLPKTPNVGHPVTLTNRERQRVLQNLWVQTAKYAVLFACATAYWTFNLNVSRRLANAPYVFWIAVFNHAQISLFALVEHVGPRFAYPQLGVPAQATDAISLAPEVAASKVMHAYNRSGLAVFLIANLFTGLVNLTFNTLDATGAVAMAILIAYTAVITGVAVGLDRAGIRIKL